VNGQVWDTPGEQTMRRVIERHRAHPSGFTQGPWARLLVYSRTRGFRHASIPAGIAALERLGTAAGFGVDATEDPAAFSPRSLPGYAAVIFVSTSGAVLDEAGKDALVGYLAAGGAWLGIHGAATTEYDWPFFAGLVGAQFDQHPPVQAATLAVEDTDHPATRHLGATWTRRDEWYAFRSNPRRSVQVLLSVDEASYQGGTMGADHPVAWCREYAGGRSFYTALGHTEESFTERAFLRHIRGGLEWLTE
jgi:type 1 glutamine amidotransferase